MSARSTHDRLLLETHEGTSRKPFIITIDPMQPISISKGRGRVICLRGGLGQFRWKREVYTPELSRYIHLNPIRAGQVRDLFGYPGSSDTHYMGMIKGPIWLENGTILGYFSRKERKAIRAYRAFVEEAMGKGVKNPFKEVVVSTFWGSPDFFEQAARNGEIPHREDMRNVPALTVLQRRPSLNETEKKIEGIKSCEDPIFRKLCSYFSHRLGRYPREEIGPYDGMKGATVSQAARTFKARLRDEKTPLCSGSRKNS